MSDSPLGSYGVVPKRGEELCVWWYDRNLVGIRSGAAIVWHFGNHIFYVSDSVVFKIIPDGASDVVVRSDKRDGLARLRVIKRQRWWTRLWNRITRRYADVPLAHVLCEGREIKRITDTRTYVKAFTEPTQ